MKSRTLFLITLALMAVLLVGCAARQTPVPVVPEGAQAGELIGLNDCEYQPADANTKYAAQCGTLVVPEVWGKGGSRLIALPVVRIPASGQSPAEPVFYLQGGPGQSNFSWAPPGWLLARHDLVFVGYRGIDGTLAKTSVTYNDTTGEIYDADIEVNSAYNEITITDDPAAIEYDLQAILTQCRDPLQKR